MIVFFLKVNVNNKAERQWNNGVGNHATFPPFREIVEQNPVLCKHDGYSRLFHDCSDVTDVNLLGLCFVLTRSSELQFVCPYAYIVPIAFCSHPTEDITG